MKVVRSGHFRNHGVRKIIHESTIKYNPEDFTASDVIWNFGTSEIDINIKGVRDGESTYDYELSLSPEDCVALIYALARGTKSRDEIGKRRMMDELACVVPELLTLLASSMGYGVAPIKGSNSDGRPRNPSPHVQGD